jgi:hypothetical protein
MAGRKINQRIIERLESFSPQQRREALALLEEMVSRVVPRTSSKRTPLNSRRRKTPGQIFWDRLVNEGLYGGDGRQSDE